MSRPNAIKTNVYYVLQTGGFCLVVLLRTLQEDLSGMAIFTLCMRISNDVT